MVASQLPITGAPGGVLAAPIQRGRPVDPRFADPTVAIEER
jgi:hypothetical protein